MDEFLSNLFRSVAQAIPTGRTNPFPGVREVTDIRTPSATGLPGGPSVSDMENYQVEFGRQRFGDVAGGWTYNTRAEGATGLSVDLGEQIAQQTEPSRNPGFRSGPVSGYARPEPRSGSGARTDPENPNRGGFAVPATDFNQV